MFIVMKFTSYRKYGGLLEKLIPNLGGFDPIPFASLRSLYDILGGFYDNLFPQSGRNNSDTRYPKITL